MPRRPSTISPTRPPGASRRRGRSSETDRGIVRSRRSRLMGESLPAPPIVRSGGPSASAWPRGESTAARVHGSSAAGRLCRLYPRGSGPAGRTRACARGMGPPRGSPVAWVPGRAPPYLGTVPGAPLRQDRFEGDAHAGRSWGLDIACRGVAGRHDVAGAANVVIVHVEKGDDPVGALRPPEAPQTSPCTVRRYHRA